MSTLAAVCPCGHTANYHPPQADVDAYRAETAGRYAVICRGGGNGPCCRCITSREEVIAATQDAE